MAFQIGVNMIAAGISVMGIVFFASIMGVFRVIFEEDRKRAPKNLQDALFKNLFVKEGPKYSAAKIKRFKKDRLS